MTPHEFQNIDCGLGGEHSFGKPCVHEWLELGLPFSRKRLWLQRGSNFWRLVLCTVVASRVAVRQAASRKTPVAAVRVLLLENHALRAG